MSEQPEEKQEEIFYVFRSRRNAGFVTISRHKAPDFCADMTEEEIQKNFKIKEVKI